MAEEKIDDFYDDDDEDLDMDMLFAQLKDLENSEMRLSGQPMEEVQNFEEDSAIDIFNDIFAQMGGFEQMEGSSMDEIRTLFDDMPEEGAAGDFDESCLKDEKAYNDIMKRLEALNSLENFKDWYTFQEEYSDDESEYENDQK